MFKVQNISAKTRVRQLHMKGFGLMLQQGAFYPGKSAAKSDTKKNRRLANTPIQLAIGSHQPGNGSSREKASANQKIHSGIN